MPLVRISLLRGKPEGFGRKVGAVVYRAMRETLNVPEKDNFQLLSEHGPESLVYDPHYLDVERSDGFIAIQITLNEGRSIEMKKAFYRRVAEDLDRQVGEQRDGPRCQLTVRLRCKGDVYEGHVSWRTARYRCRTTSSPSSPRSG